MRKAIVPHDAIKIVREELAWAAGFFDGEGMIRAYAGHKNTAPALMVRISQVDRRPLDRLHAAISGLGKIYGPKAPQSPRSSPYYTLSFTTFEAAQAAVAMLWPFLSPPKKEDAARAIGIMRGWFAANRLMCRKRLHILADVGRTRVGSCEACSAISRRIRSDPRITPFQRNLLVRLGE